MLNSTFYLAGIFLVLFCTAGFFGSLTSDSATESEGHSDVVTPHTVLSLSTESLIVTINTGLPDKECELARGASKRDRAEFADCIVDSGCEDWERYTDSSNGNTVVVCKPT